jgi:hypothetical protein
MSNVADGSGVPTTREPALDGTPLVGTALTDHALTDHALLRDLAAGETSAFAEIYDRHGRVVYA